MRDESLAEKKYLTATRKIVITISLYIIIVLAIMWALGFVLLRPFYSFAQKKNVERQVKIVAENIDNEATLPILVTRIAHSRDMCIAVVEAGSFRIIASEHIWSGCKMHNSGQIKEYYYKAKNNGNTYSEVTKGAFVDANYNPGNYSGNVPDEKARPRDSYTTAIIATNKQNNNYIVVAEVSITPLIAEIHTLTYQLLSLSAFMILVGLVIMKVLKDSLIMPVVALSEASKDIVKGDAEFENINVTYKEADDLRNSLDYATKELSKLDMYRKELIANVSHDLRTPLALIKGYSEMMKDIPSEANPENIQVVIDETTRLVSLVNDMLDLSRLQAGGDLLRIRVFDLVEVLDDLLKRHGKLLEAQGYKVVWEHEKEAFVYADETKIVQVIYNLLNNAVNYSGEDKTVIVRQITKGLNIRIEVIDNGEGVDVEILPHIWDRYYKSEKSHKRAVVGTGLGLSIVKSVMNMHPGGVYGVITSVGEGSTFYIELPKIDPDTMDIENDYPELVE